jgi:hypothetical protein
MSRALGHALSSTRHIVDASCFTRAREHQICRVYVKSTRVKRQPAKPVKAARAAINRRHRIYPSRTDGRLNPLTPTQFLNPTGNAGPVLSDEGGVSRPG